MRQGRLTDDCKNVSTPEMNDSGSMAGSGHGAQISPDRLILGLAQSVSDAAHGAQRVRAAVL